jgi:hypothetical protein
MDFIAKHKKKNKYNGKYLINQSVVSQIEIENVPKQSAGTK